MPLRRWLVAILFFISFSDVLFSQNLLVERSVITEQPAEANAVPATTVSTIAFEFRGMYAPDGVFLSPENRARYSHFVTPSEDLDGSRASAVPGFVQRNSIEREVDNYAPPARATTSLKKYSFWGNLRDKIITFAYGRQKILQTPLHLILDSRNRVIVSDPAINSIHILDRENSVRIVGGPDRRLQRPNGIAVDANDNIYVADEQRKVVLVFDRDGVYSKMIGEFKGETLFENPTGIAIDKARKLLYVLDTPAHEVVVLDLDGTVVTRIGGNHVKADQRLFDTPTEIAVRNGRVAILDAGLSRIQVFGPGYARIAVFRVRGMNDAPEERQVGLGLDEDGDVYLSNLFASTLKVFNLSGKTIADFGRYGAEDGQFRAPSGLWVENGRVFVADTNNSRIQVFDTHPGERKSVPAPAIIASHR